MSSRPSRRAVLRAGLALPLVAACTGAPPEPAPPPDPDLPLRARAGERERALLAAYDEAALAAPSLAPRLAALRAEHAEHARAVGAVDPAAPPAASGAPSPLSSSAPPSPGPSRAPVPPRDPAAVLAGLLAAEQEAAAEHGRDALLASRELAGVLASLAASEASHAVALS